MDKTGEVLPQTSARGVAESADPPILALVPLGIRKGGIAEHAQLREARATSRLRK